jgi:hypothetical protein
MSGAAVDSSGDPLVRFAWFDAVRQFLARFPLSVIQLAGRIGVGTVFFKAGLLKYRSWDFTVLLFRDEYKVPLLDPAVAARIAMIQELTIPIFLFLGLRGHPDIRLSKRLQRPPRLGLDSRAPAYARPRRLLVGLPHRARHEADGGRPASRRLSCRRGIALPFHARIRHPKNQSFRRIGLSMSNNVEVDDRG